MEDLFPAWKEGVRVEFIYIYNFLPAVSQGTLIQNNKICHEGIFWGSLPEAPTDPMVAKFIELQSRQTTGNRLQQAPKS